MTEYNTLHVKMSNSQLKKLKLEIKNCAEVTLNLSSNVISDSNDEISFPQQSFSTYAKLLKMVHQRKQKFQNPNYLRWYG